VRVVAASSSAPAPKIKGKGKIYHEPIKLYHFQGVGVCHECIYFLPIRKNDQSIN